MNPLLAALKTSNLNLLHEGEKLGELLDLVRGDTPPELVPYFDYCSAFRQAIEQNVRVNLQGIELNRDDLLPELLSETQRLSRAFQGLNQVVLPPLFRASPRDRLCLWVLRWLHANHPPTVSSILAMSDGSFSVRPMVEAPIYYIPSSNQHGLLYLPLLFHEFGHLLYEHHKHELHDLIVEMQEKIRRQLEPAVSRGDDYDQAKAEERRRVVETWYDWMEEFFCDAVGFSIGGVAFAEAFSNFLLMKGDDVFYLPPERLYRSSHPVSRMRIHLLTSRVERDGHTEAAGRIRGMWDAVAKAKGLVENYHGFFEPRFVPTVEKTLDDMLTEAAPVRFTGPDPAARSDVPPGVLSAAWLAFRRSPEEYPGWEKEFLKRLFNEVVTPSQA